MSKEEDRRKAFDEIRKINNQIHIVKLTFLELEQLQTWLANIEPDDEIAQSILERIEIALEDSKSTGVSV